MTETVQNLLETFERLSEVERREAAAEILRRVTDEDYPPLDDQTIDQIANDTFLEYDAREAVDGKS